MTHFDRSAQRATRFHGARLAAVAAFGGRSARSTAIALLVAVSAALSPADAQEGERPVEPAIPADFFDALEFRHIGPLGNRVIAVTGEPGNANVYYVGAASGGVFKSTDAGHSWTPVFDDQPASSIGALAIAPSDPNVVWAGTGETFIRANISLGNGVYRSTDGGESWTRAGLDATGRIGRIRVHPSDPDHAYVCALGHTYGPQAERGVYRTTDGGSSWEQILAVDPDTGCADLAMDPNNPRILFAGMWQIEVNTWGRKSGGPGSSLWRTKDGGDTWEKLEGAGLPHPPWGKIGLGMARADSRRVYALIETSSNRDFAPSDPFQGVLWRSDDGGDSWDMVNASNDLTARPLYYTRLLASPADADEVYFLALRHSTSLDGGRSHFRTPTQPGGDHHDMWIDPLDPNRMIVGHDQGISISSNRGETWYRPQLPIAQMYHANVDRRIPYYVYGNRQDGPSSHGPSNTLTGGTIPVGEWRSVGGCETGFAVPDTVDARTVWTGCYDGMLERHDLVSGYSRNVSVWPLAVESWPGEDLEYRWQWTFPIEISPHDHLRVYVGSQYVHRTTDGGQSWEVISPDLTTDDPELKRRTGGLTLDDAGPTMAPTVFAIAESPLEDGVIWVGSNDGLVHITRDGGANWSDVTGGLPDLPPRGTISNIHPSRHSPGTAYLSVDRHQLGDFDPYVYATDDYGASWRRIDAGIPRSVLSFTHVVIEDPVTPGLLYVGTENGIHISFGGGDAWHQLVSNLPHAPVHSLTVQDHFNDLVVATYGRGFWILDDVTPLQNLATRLADAQPGSNLPVGNEPILLAPRPAYRFRSRASPMSQPGDPAAGQNPEYGATLHYYLPVALGDDEGPVDEGREAGEDEAAPGDAAAADPTLGAVDESPELEIAIVDASGVEVRVLEDLPREAGLHRVHWDLRGEPSAEPRLLMDPLENPHVPTPEQGWRSMPDGGRMSILVPPGEYEVRLTVGGRTFRETLELRKDPNSAGSVGDIERQMPLLDRLWTDLDRSAEMINDVESLRLQLAVLGRRLADSREDVDDLVDQARMAETALEALEGELFDLRHTGAGQDGLRWKRLLYARLGYLARSINQSDDPPTDQQSELTRVLGEELNALESRLQSIVDDDLDALNEALRARGVPNVLLRRADAVS